MVVEYGDTRAQSGNLGPFNICAYDPSTLEVPQTQEPVISYYSNPVGNRLSVESPYNIKTLQVYDLLGRGVLRKHPEKSNLTLDTFTLAPGVYLMHVETAKGGQTVKLVKK